MMKKLAKMFLMMFVLFLIFSFKVTPQDADTLEINTDTACGKKKIVVDFQNPFNSRQISREEAMQSENYTSGDKTSYSLKLKPKAVSEYKDGLKNSQEIDPDELDLESENLVDIFKMQSGEFLADYEIALYTEADCDNITWTLGGQTHPSTLSCDSLPLAFTGVPAGTHDMVFEGCGGRWEGSGNVTGDGGFVVCPSDLQIEDCCPEGVLSGGAYYCDECPGPPPDTTSTTVPSTTSTVPPPPPTTTTAPVAGSSVYLCTEVDCPSGFTWTFGGQKHSSALDCDTILIFKNLTERCYTSFVSGCGFVWENDICVDGHSDYHYYLCPGETDLGCCEFGCGMDSGEYDGSFVCDGCPKFTISGRVTGDCSSNVTIKLSGSDEDEVETDINGHYEFEDVVGGGPYYITPEYDEDCVFKPQNYTIQNLIKDLDSMDFECECKPPEPPPDDSCPPEEIYGENSEEVELLRNFRDNVLNRTKEGQEIIRLYYQWSPVIVEAMEKDKTFKEEVKSIIDEILPLIRVE